MQQVARRPRVAVVSMHTSPLATPGSGDAGGLNVFVANACEHLAAAGAQPDVFTLGDRDHRPGTSREVGWGRVHFLGPDDAHTLRKAELPSYVDQFADQLASHPAAATGFDVIHSHYWLSGMAALRLRERWGSPIVHTMHTMAAVKNAHLPDGDSPEPEHRVAGEARIVAAAARLTANTAQEAHELAVHADADPDRIDVVPPGVDLDTFTPGDRDQARRELGIEPDAVLLLFVGRVQPFKAPHVVIEAAAALAAQHPELDARLHVAILGGQSGTGYPQPDYLPDLARATGRAAATRFAGSVSRTDLARWYRAADVLLVPSHNESFGLVALEALACGTPVVAARAGGLPVAVGSAGLLVEGHDPSDWARAVAAIVGDPERRDHLSRTGIDHARDFSWDHTARLLLAAYERALAAPPTAGGPVAGATTGPGGTRGAVSEVPADGIR